MKNDFWTVREKMKNDFWTVREWLEFVQHPAEDMSYATVRFGRFLWDNWRLTRGSKTIRMVRLNINGVRSGLMKAYPRTQKAYILRLYMIWREKDFNRRYIG